LPFLTYPPAFGAPLGLIPVEFRQDFWRQKTRVMGYMVLLAWHYV